jgi:hypothetical protein
VRELATCSSSSLCADADSITNGLDTAIGLANTVTRQIDLLSAL